MQGIRFLKYLGVAILVIALSVLLAILAHRQEQYRIDLENMYEKSYYNTLDAIANIEINLEKLEIATSRNEQEKLLKEVWRDSSVAEANLAQLNARDDSFEKIIKFINQLGDYCYYLSAKLDNEIGSLTSEEYENLARSQTVVTAMHTELYAVHDEIQNGNKLMGDFNKDLNFLTAVVANINELTVEYPGLIYDGPFSDGLNDRVTRALSGMSDLSVDEAQQKVEEYFEDYHAVGISYMGEAGGDAILSYMFSLTVDGLDATVLISKKGGKMVQYNAFENVISVNFDEDECIEKAELFVERAGYSNMIPVWVNNIDSTIYVNFAYKENDVIVYCDLIKVKVEAGNGHILGLEANGYIYNHEERNYSPVKTESQAREMISNKVNIDKVQLAYIPTEWNTEILVYEYQVTYKERTYFICINANTLREEKIMLVIKDNGNFVV